MKMDIFLNKKAEQDFTLGWANHVYFSPLGYSSTYINWGEGKGRVILDGNVSEVLWPSLNKL